MLSRLRGLPAANRPRALTQHTCSREEPRGLEERGRHRDVYPLPGLLWLIPDFFEASADLQALEGISSEGFCQLAGRPSITLLAAQHKPNCPVVWNIPFLSVAASGTVGLYAAGMQAEDVGSNHLKAACAFLLNYL